MAKKRKAPKRKEAAAQARRRIENLPLVEVRAEEEDGEWGPDGLTVRQRKFVDALVGPAAGSAIKAAELAGYAAENRRALAATACRLLSCANTQEAIAHALARLRATPEWAQNNLVAIARSSMANFLSRDDNGQVRLDLEKATENGSLGQIREYREEVLKVPGGETELVKRTIKIHDPTGATATLLKLFGMITERHEHTGPDGGPIEHRNAELDRLSLEELRTLRELRAKMEDKPSAN